MIYKRFEDLPVWNAAIVFADRIYDLTDDPALKPSFRNQLERAALSISNNIAEGFERGSTNELIAFLYIARGSAGEARSMLRFVGRRKVYSHLAPILPDLVSLSESCSRQIYAWITSLQKGSIKGQRHHPHSSPEKQSSVT